MKTGLVLAYNTNGFFGHTLEDATRIMADLGYGGVALTPDVHHLNPYRCTSREVETYGALLQRLGLDVVIETGARFILDPMRKHYPSLLSPGKGADRLEYLERCTDLARDLGARALSFHSGSGPGHSGSATVDASEEALWETLAESAERLLAYGDSRDVPVALEPEPGMFIETVADFDTLAARLNRPGLRLTLDVGHLHVSEDREAPELIGSHAAELINVHLDDARGKRHEHLPLGDGEIDFPPILHALESLGKDLFLSVELSRHGHDAVNQARNALEFLGTLD